MDSAHWLLAVICNPAAAGTSATGTMSSDTPVLAFLDSLGGDSDAQAQTLHFLKGYLASEWVDCVGGSYDSERLKSINIEVPFQQNSDDCGIYMLEFVLQLLHRSDALKSLASPTPTHCLVVPTEIRHRWRQASSELRKPGDGGVVRAMAELRRNLTASATPTPAATVAGKEVAAALPPTRQIQPQTAQTTAKDDSDSDDDMLLAPAAPPAKTALAAPPVKTAVAQPAVALPKVAQPAVAQSGGEKRKEPEGGSSGQPPAKKDGKEKKLSKDGMESKVLEYMQQQNRPYNVQNVFDNLHGVVPKTQVQIILDSLTISGQISVKEYGKIKIYLVAQTSGSGQADVADEANELQSEVDVATAKLQGAKTSLEEVKKAVGSLRSRRDAQQEVAALASEAPELEQRLAALRAASEAANEAAPATVEDTADMEKVEASCRASHKEWRRRKRLCNEILYRISEGSGMKVPQLADKYGVDTDEACEQPFPESML